MALTYGFYNSLNGDRKYDALQVSSLFDGLIKDGVFATIGSAFNVTASSGNTVNIGTGKAWFDHTWTLNDAVLQITLPPAEVLLPRIDAIVLEVNATESVRANSFKILEGTPSSTPARPTLTKSLLNNQYAICYITRAAGSSEIKLGDISMQVGKSGTPYVTGIIDTVNIDNLFNTWQEEFDSWFNIMKDQLSTDAAGNLQTQIDINKALMQNTNYSITDNDLKAMFGSASTMKSILQSLGRKVLYESTTGLDVGGTKNLDLSLFSHIEVTFMIGDNASSYHIVYKVEPVMTGGTTYYATGSTSVIVVANKLTYSGGKLKYDSTLARIIRETAVVNYTNYQKITKIVGVV